ncbi:MAG: class B sortase [Erysipelotrichaceae bacterium]|nr:class B sortase [Erysipelotrichaceae bacterium]
MKRLLVILITLLVLCGCSKKPVEVEKTETDDNQTVELVEPAKNLIAEEKRAEYKALWNDNHNINGDYIGQVFFESGLLNQPVVQAADNDYYLRRNFATLAYDEYGTVFEDSYCDLDSQNIIMYGHYVYSYYHPQADELMFTPLKFLKQEENYEANKTVYLLLEDELREYEVVAVYYCDLYQDGGYWYPNQNLIYYYTEYDQTYFEKYKYAIGDAQFYDTGKEYSVNDRFLTLQTCVENREDLREIVLCKQVDTYYYE